LRICDGEGAISPVLFDKAGMFRWFPQEHQGLLVGYDYTNKWADLKPLLSPEQEKQIADESMKLRRKVFSYHGDQKKFAENALRTFNYPLEAALHLHSVASPDIEKMTKQKWPAYSSVKVPVFYIKQCQVDAQSIKIGKTLDRGIDEIVELKVSPNGKYIACVKHESAQERNFIEIISAQGNENAAFVATNTNSFPAWSNDARALFYSRCNTGSEPDLLKGHGVHEGGLFKVEVADAAGKKIAAMKSVRLANLIFDNRAPIHAMKDGRILFVSREIRLPNSVNATPAAVLFSLEGNKVETIVRRNDDIAYFEANQDQDMLAISTSSSALIVCKANGTEQSELCNGKDLRISGLLPQWKSNQELSYGTETAAAAKGSKPAYSVLLWTKGAGAAKDLSKAWGKEAASEINIHRDFFQEAMTGVMQDLDRASDKH
ncbi:MAG: hypothetical protein K2X81_23190, partial [Candidatus Obscuribacterales bacterium]|nr:hypothetical protein [Candidatus Obscuribacterales bacterium]